MNDHDYVFNMVWTGEVFDHLQVFAASLLEHTEARFRFVGNACPPEQLRAMERFAERCDGRVVEVLDVSSRRMVRHGDALDTVLASRDDGALFCFIDPDILARAPFLSTFSQLLETNAVVTSGKEVWSESNVRPDGHVGVNGEIFFDRDGFVFGSPHLAMYRADILREVVDRWGIGFSSAGGDAIPAHTKARLEEFGRSYWIYDTAKVVNIMIQADGHPLAHEEHPELVHVGGVSHFLAPPMTPEGMTPVWGENQVDWGSWDGMADRHAVARFTADVLTAALAGTAGPELPETLPETVRSRLEVLRQDLRVLAERYGPSTDRYVAVAR